MMPSTQAKQPKTLAVYAASGLGDALLATQIAAQMHIKGWRTTVFSSVLLTMASWFPHIDIQPFPAETSLWDELGRYDHVIAADFTPLSRQAQPNERLSILSHRNFDRSKPILHNLLAFCHTHFDTPMAREQSYQVPPSLQSRRHQQRIVIHPTSGWGDHRNWPADKYVNLAQRLQKEGWSPVMAVSVCEADKWDWVRGEGIALQPFSTIDEMARFYYESGYFIGNDSGGGHLASLLNVPTLTVGARQSHLRFWRPGWGPGRVVTPFLPLPGASLKQRYWKKFLTVNRVLKAFHHLHLNK